MEAPGHQDQRNHERQQKEPDSIRRAALKLKEDPDHTLTVNVDRRSPAGKVPLFGRRFGVHKILFAVIMFALSRLKKETL